MTNSMSDDYLHIIPEDPNFVPDPAAGRRALELLREMAPAADETGTTQTPGVKFVDPGENLERISCPPCGATVPTDLWVQMMEAAAAIGFQALSVQLPCCSVHTSLNDLNYDWPAGFARFRLWARNASIGGHAPTDTIDRKSV